MVVIIPHSTEDLKLISFQKELIDLLFSNDRIIYRTTPLWIELPDDFSAFDKESLKACSKNVQLVELGEVEIEKDNIYIPVKLKTVNCTADSKLTLVRLHSGNIFSDIDLKSIRQKKQPVRQLKIFRLGIVQAEGPHAKSISDFAWCKLHHTSATVK